MQFEVKDLIDKIKKDGLEEAERISNDIISKARKEADDIISNAKEAAQALKIKSENEVNDYKLHSLETVRLAVRDLFIGVEKDIKSLIENALRDSVVKSFDNNFLTELIVKIVDAWIPGEKLKVILNESDFDDLKSMLKSKLGSEFIKGVDLKPFKGINKGFKIQKGSSGLCYDFTSETIADILFDYVNPRFKEVVKMG